MRSVVLPRAAAESLRPGTRLRRSVSSIQTSSRLAVATSPSSSHTLWTSRKTRRQEPYCRRAAPPACPSDGHNRRHCRDALPAAKCRRLSAASCRRSSRALSDRVGHRKNPVAVLIQKQMVVAEMRAAHVPVEVLGLHIEREDIGRRFQRARPEYRAYASDLRSVGVPRRSRTCASLLGRAPVSFAAVVFVVLAFPLKSLPRRV